MARHNYDGFGNLRGVALPNGKSITYVIDGEDRRVAKKVNGAQIDGFLYSDDLRRVKWVDGTGATKAQFIFGQQEHVPDYMVKGTTNYLLVYDQIGSIRLVVDPSGGIVGRLDYDEFGNVLNDTAPGFQPMGYAGGVQDGDTGLLEFGARDFDPATGRWFGKDPLLFGGGDLNLYQYASDDPINFSDPTGLATYVCTKPLDALGWFWKNQRKSVPGLGLPTFHEYLCVVQKGRRTCNGQGRAGGGLPFGNPGAPSNDPWNPFRCDETPSTGCIDKCVEDQLLRADRPQYDLWPVWPLANGSGQNCQQWARTVLMLCRAACGGGSR